MSELVERVAKMKAVGGIASVRGQHTHVPSVVGDEAARAIIEEVSAAITDHYRRYTPTSPTRNGAETVADWLRTQAKDTPEEGA